MRLNTTGAHNRLPEVGHQIKLIKEQMLSHHANLLLPIFTRQMEIELAKHVVILLNNFPLKSGISTTYSPRKIMIGKTLDRKNMCKLLFGAYVQVHEDRSTRNILV